MKDDIDFRFQGPGIYGDNFYNQFWLDENAEYHRTDGPAIRYPDGGEVWMKHGKRHRADDLPAVTDAKGSQAWYIDDLLHRKGKPAITHADGTPPEWWEQGRRLADEEVAAILAQQEYESMARRGKEVADALQTPHGTVKASKPARFSK